MQYDKLGLEMLYIFPGAALLPWHLLQSALKSVIDIKNNEAVLLGDNSFCDIFYFILNLLK